VSSTLRQAVQKKRRGKTRGETEERGKKESPTSRDKGVLRRVHNVASGRGEEGGGRVKVKIQGACPVPCC